MTPEKETDYLATQETDGDFFGRMFAMERRILTERGDQEGLAALEKMAQEAASEGAED